MSIASSGAIATLCALLGSPSDRAQKNAASALSTLANGNVENMQQVYEGDGYGHGCHGYGYGYGYS